MWCTKAMQVGVVLRSTARKASLPLRGGQMHASHLQIRYCRYSTVCGENVLGTPPPHKRKQERGRDEVGMEWS